MKGEPAVLIVFGGRYGQTAKIARRIAERAGAEGMKADLMPVKRMPRNLQLETYEAVIIAAPVFFGRYQRAVERFVSRNLAQLSVVRNALVSVSNAAAADRTTAEEYVQQFARRTGWTPDSVLHAGGAEEWSRYGFFTRMIVRSAIRKTGREPDTTRDVEYTKWDEVDGFAAELLRRPALRVVASL